MCQCAGMSDPDLRALHSTLDPKTSHHAPQCEFASETNVAVLRVVLEVKDGAGDEAYWWVECSACDTAWQVPHYSAQSVG